jgi:hypothetical protein
VQSLELAVFCGLKKWAQVWADYVNVINRQFISNLLPSMIGGANVVNHLLDAIITLQIT